MEVIERPGWLQLVTPTLRQGGLNGVSLSRLADDEADRVIDETIARYRALGLRFRWVVCPDATPADLAERLERRGLARASTRAMARPTEGFEAHDDPGLSVVEVDEPMLPAFDRVMGEGWGIDPAPLAAYHRVVFAREPRPVRLYLGLVEGRPAATAATFLFERSAYLMGAVVLPSFRGRGLYRALVAARLQDAAARGLGLATTQAKEETSAPRLERMGFQTVCRLSIFLG
jgi:GNAT superfamily N-acetyltransferase